MLYKKFSKNKGAFENKKANIMTFSNKWKLNCFANINSKNKESFEL
jgi:hypothetical protein